MSPAENGEHWVIVGAGSAGCVLANRLSAEGSRHVTLLDDGPDLAPSSVPAAISGPNFFHALHEPGRMHDDLLASRVGGGARSLYQRGRGIGGSSVVNAMVALRGSTELYESWGWHDTAAAWNNVMLEIEQPASSDLGVVSSALLAADPRGAVADLTRLSGRRVTSAEAYLWPALERPNLAVRPESAVDVLVVENHTAVGVRLRNGEEIAADRVILAAGAIHTPAILLRSGVDNVGVGMGLQDHPSAVFTLQLRKGVAQDMSGLPIGSLLHATIGEDLIQLLPMSNLGSSNDSAGLGALMVALMTPTSRSGTVTVDAGGSPRVDFRLLDDERDVHALVAGVNLALDVLGRDPFTAVVDDVFIDDQGTTADVLSTDDAIIEWLRQRCGDYVHASSTCAMGTVVDERGSVLGYRGLSVCDASIFPSIPDANTHLPTTMVAERMCMAGRLVS